MSDVLFFIGICFTVGHVVLDLRQFSIHVTHPRDWLVLISAFCLVGHVIFTGEAAQWMNVITSIA